MHEKKCYRLKQNRQTMMKHDLSFSDSGPELGTLSLAIVLGVGHDSLYDYNVLLVDHSHCVQCLLLARSV